MKKKLLKVKHLLNDCLMSFKNNKKNKKNLKFKNKKYMIRINKILNKTIWKIINKNNFSKAKILLSKS